MSDFSKITYTEFTTLIKSVMTSNFITDFKAKAEGIDYRGFSIELMFKAIMSKIYEAGWTDEKCIQSLCILMLALHMRGPNISNITENNTTKSEAFKLFAEARDVLGILKQAGKNPLAITLPRISLIFPTLSSKVWFSHCDLIKIPVSTSMIGFENCQKLFPSHVPCFFAQSGVVGNEAKMLMIHNLYQMHLSNLAQWPSKQNLDRRNFKPKTIETFIIPSIKFSQMARTNSKLTKDQKEEVVKLMNTNLPKDEAVIDIMMPIADCLKVSDCDFTITTSFELALVYLIKNKNDLDRNLLLSALKARDYETAVNKLSE